MPTHSENQIPEHSLEKEPWIAPKVERFLISTNTASIVANVGDGNNSSTS